ncbi:MAG: peptide ABC transporter substrate-binding protein [Chloroflexi bacterium]|nr:peptide ABC transporter substrate-binding protein [Chloroflexota bacterium]
MAMRNHQRFMLTGLIAALLVLSACGPAAPAPTAAPSPTLTPLPPAGEDGTYPVRYFHTELPVSLEPPPGWLVSEETGGMALAAIDDADTGAQILLNAEAPDTGASASDANLLAVRTLHGAEAVIDEATELTFESGEPGYLRRGVEAFLAAARSLRLESYDPLPLDRGATLSLDAGDAEELDPAITHVGPSGAVGDLFRGLVVLDPNLQIRPAIAERWDVSPDGAVYTFHLNPAARFHNGRPVTADDVVFSWERAASPAIGSSTVLTYMGDIAGLAAFNAGSADSISGLELIDELTLQVTLAIPRPTFLYKLAYPVSWIVDRYNVGFPGWERHPNGTGPYRLAQHLQDQVLLLEANPWFYAGEPAIRSIRYLMYAGYTQQLYETGDVDQAYVTRDQITRVEDPSDGLYGTLVTEPAMCTNYVSFNTSEPPFDDARVRQAFAHTVDRQRYVEAITNGEDLAARGLLPPGMPGFGASLDLPDYDPQSARALLAGSAYVASSLPEIVWTVPTSGGWASPAVAFLADGWQRDLGVEVRVEGIEWQEYYERLDAGDFGQILLEGWCADYPDPENFLEALFHSTSAQNHAHYASAEFDQLVERARVETDLAQRLEAYRLAEQMLLDDAPAVFLNHSGPSFMIWRPDVGGYLPAAIGVPQHAGMWKSD